MLWDRLQRARLVKTGAEITAEDGLGAAPRPGAVYTLLPAGRDGSARYSARVFFSVPAEALCCKTEVKQGGTTALFCRP